MMSQVKLFPFSSFMSPIRRLFLILVIVLICGWIYKNQTKDHLSKDQDFLPFLDDCKCTQDSEWASSRDNIYQWTSKISKHERFTYQGKYQIRTQVIEPIMRQIGFKMMTPLSYQGPLLGGDLNTGEFTVNEMNGTSVFGILYSPFQSASKIYSQGRIFIVMAHYDSVFNTTATFDNAAGVAVLLETARQLKLMLKHSGNQSLSHFWFVVSDHEEKMGNPLSGSAYFVNSFVPRRLHDRIAGVFVLDSLGAWSNKPDSQFLPPLFKYAFPKASMVLKRHGMRADFVAAISDKYSWKLSDAFEVVAKQCGFGNDLTMSHRSNNLSSNGRHLNMLRFGSKVLSGKSMCEKWYFAFGNLCRSDHMNFWESQIPAVHLTDTANFRSSCYHKPCDNITQLSENSLNFLASIARTLSSTLGSFQ